MKLKYLLTFLILLTIGLAVGPKSAGAYVTTYYGEIPPAGLIELYKKVKDPSANSFVDNLGVNDYKFAPGEEIIFQIKVKNNGKIDFENVKIADYLPSYVELVSGQTEINFQDLKPDETRDFEIKVKVVTADKLPSQQGLYCLVNKAEVVADNQKAEDTTQACIESKVLGAAVQPKAGVNLLVLGSSFLGLSSLGFLLKKKIKIN